jgi:hypothetical protein
MMAHSLQLPSRMLKALDLQVGYGNAAGREGWVGGWGREALYPYPPGVACSFQGWQLLRASWLQEEGAQDPARLWCALLRDGAAPAVPLLRHALTTMAQADLLVCAVTHLSLRWQRMSTALHLPCPCRTTRSRVFAGSLWS